MECGENIHGFVGLSTYMGVVVLGFLGCHYISLTALNRRKQIIQAVY